MNYRISLQELYRISKNLWPSGLRNRSTISLACIHLGCVFKSCKGKCTSPLSKLTKIFSFHSPKKTDSPWNSTIVESGIKHQTINKLLVLTIFFELIWTTTKVSLYKNAPSALYYIWYILYLIHIGLKRLIQFNFNFNLTPE